MRLSRFETKPSDQTEENPNQLFDGFGFCSLRWERKSPLLRIPDPAIVVPTKVRARADKIK